MDTIERRYVGRYCRHCPTRARSGDFWGEDWTTDDEDYIYCAEHNSLNPTSDTYKSGKPIDVWLRFESEQDEEASHEANTFIDEDGGFRIEWYNTAVGQVSTVHLSTVGEVHEWYAKHGYQDFTA